MAGPPPAYAGLLVTPQNTALKRFGFLPALVTLGEIKAATHSHELTPQA